ncbi:MAG TPA: ATP-binding protein [Candidatus Paceibacterota bacterium]|nr:ATP-binding protein [Candidatus Paceibacterota bacterium]
MNATTLQRFRSVYSPQEWRIAGILFVSYIAVYEAAFYFLPPGAKIYPAITIAIVALFFGGLRLWPVVYCAAVIGMLLVGASFVEVLIIPCSVLLQSLCTVYILRAVQIDPLFRRYRDTFYLMGTVAIVAVIRPTFDLLIDAIFHRADTAAAWESGYIANAFVLIVFTPFLMRWIAKPRFTRHPIEVIETAIIFTILIFLDVAIFVEDAQTFVGIPLSYFLLFPFFWIAIRLRPRFITLALVLTALFAITSVVLTTPPQMVQQTLFLTESFMIALSILFFVVTSLEEDRRVSMNTMRSQLHTLENAVEKIRNESRAKNEFIAILAHELRNPLAPVLSGIDLLRLKSAQEKEDREVLQMMGDQMTTVRRLLDDLLDISRISEGKITLKRESVDLEAIMRRAIISTNHHRQELHQPLTVNFPKRPIRIAADPVRLEQIFSNLLTNASKYSDSGDRISMTVRDEVEMVEVEVADEGIGLTESAMKTIFMPFNQIEHGERTKKGLGIGLALVQAFAEMHGGSVRAESEGPGRGSRFIVRLPVLLSENNQAVVPHKDQGPERTQKGNSLVLIVDDNDTAAGAIGRLLELQGYKVAYAYNGKQAIDQAILLSPQAVLLDLGLPGEDGFTVARRLHEKGFKGKLIALSGYSGIEARQRAKQAGFEEYLVKPAGLADLRRVLPAAR